MPCLWLEIQTTLCRDPEQQSAGGTQQVESLHHDSREKLTGLTLRKEEIEIEEPKGDRWDEAGEI